MKNFYSICRKFHKSQKIRHKFKRNQYKIWARRVKTVKLMPRVKFGKKVQSQLKILNLKFYIIYQCLSKKNYF